MKMIFSKIAVLVVLCTPALADDPVAWTDRCYAEAEAQKDAPLTPEKITHNHCLATIINYCAFAPDSDACFVALQIEFELRTNSVLAALPKTIEGSSFEQRMYQKRLEVREALSNARRCELLPEPMLCETMSTMMAHQILQSLSDRGLNDEEN